MSTGKYKGLVINTALFAVNALATKLVTFLLVPLYTCYMTAAEYGISDMSLTVISLITPLATLSVADAVVRFSVGNNGDLARYSGIGFFITAFSVLLVSLLLPLLDLEIFGGLGQYKAYFLLAYVASSFFQLLGGIARGMGIIRLIPICAAVSSLVTCVLAVVLIGWKSMSVVGYFISISVGPLAGSLLYLTVGGIGRVAVDGMVHLLGDGHVGAFRKYLAPMLNYSLPLIPNSLFWWISTSINRFYITGMLGIGASGLFAAASKVPNLLNTAYSIFQQAWQLSAFEESGSKNISRFFSTVFSLLQAGMTLLCAFISYLSPTVAAFFLQGSFFIAWPMIPILLIANLFSVFNSFFGTVYTTTMNTKYIFKTTFWGAIACVGLTPPMVLVMGINGACVASALSNGIIFLMRASDSQKQISIDVKWHVFIATLAVLVLQASVTAARVDMWHEISGLCVLSCVCLQLVQVWPVKRSSSDARFGILD